MTWQLQEFNYKNTSAQMKKSCDWSRDSINIFREISKISSVYFLPIRYDNNCFYGRLTYIQEKDLSTILLDNNLAMRKL